MSHNSLLLSSALRQLADEYLVEQSGIPKFLEMVQAIVESEVKRTAEKGKGLLAAIPDLTLHIDSNGIIVDYHAPADWHSHFIDSSCLGKPFSAVMAKDVVNMIRAAISRLSLNHVVETFESEFQAEGKAKRIVEFRIATTNADEHLVLVRDMTERRRAEEVIRQTANSLTARNVELAMARDEALAASRSKSEFLANMSHEIRTPMNGVMGMVDLLTTTSLNSMQRSYAQTIRSSADALLTVINDILDFSKIEAGKLTISSEDFDLRNLVEEVASLLAPRAHESGLQLTVVIPPDFPSGFHGDAGRIRQVLTNLIGNAIKFTERGEIVIKASARADHAENYKFRLTVSDTGIGISSEKLSTIFDSFTQVDYSSTRRYGGSGLGLAICRRLVDLMSGSIGVESEAGVGSDFWFELTLPVLQIDRKDFGETKAFDGLKVLIIEPSATTRHMLRDQLVAWKCLCTECENASDALQKLSNTQPDLDLIIFDNQTARMDGIEFAKATRALERYGSTAMILLTSDGRLDSDKSDAGLFISTLHKPVRQAALLHAISLTFQKAPVEKLVPVVDQETPLNLRVLLAEDNTINQTVAVALLKGMGCAVVVSPNGLEAFEKVKQQKFDAILMDCQMPIMDGFEATREIRAFEADLDRRTPIIALTAIAMQGDRERCLRAGMDDYVPKPIKQSELRSALLNWTSQVEKVQGTEPKASVLDSKDLLSRCGGDLELARTVIAQFIAVLPQMLADIEASVGAADAKRIYEASHALKGAAITAGGHQLGHAVLDLEVSSLSRVLSNSRSQFELIRVRAEQVLEEYRESSTS